MRPEKSGNLEVFFAVERDRPILKRPFYFHHVPKTSGTAFRHAARQWLWSQDAGELIAPHFGRLTDAAAGGDNPLAAYLGAVAGVARIEAVMGHYTARLASAIDDPIVAMVREPDAQLASQLAFQPRQLKKLGRAVLETGAANNPQMRSLTGEDIPLREPAEPGERQRWLALVERTLERFTLFRSEDRGALIAHCAEVYGLPVAEQPRLKVRAPDEAVDRRVDKMMKIAKRKHDPVWLDRILYERVAQREAGSA